MKNFYVYKKPTLIGPHYGMIEVELLGENHIVGSCALPKSQFKQLTAVELEKIQQFAMQIAKLNMQQNNYLKKVWNSK